jgi:hypothetical protein
MKNSRAAGSRYMNLVVLAARLAVAPATAESRNGGLDSLVRGAH